MTARIVANNICLDVPIFLQRERGVQGWGGLFMGAAFDPPRRSLVRLLDGVSFRLNEGDRLAILGRNGAGKSTLLRVLNRVYQPTSGELTVEGSCQALLNMSLGFSVDATVRENIFLRGVAMGLRASFLREQVDSILDFSGLREKTNHRLRTLSSGQRLRLGFAISTSVQNDIMLMDEWVGAGDAEFMARAKERMQNRVGGSKIVVLASHSLGLVREVCNRGIVIERGRLVYEGEIARALKHYQVLVHRPPNHADAPLEVDDESGSMGNVTGTVDELQLDGGTLVVRGWALRDFSRPVDAVVVDVLGDRVVCEDIERLPRRDVQAHFGLVDPGCGYRIRVDVGDDVSVEAIARTLEVSGIAGAPFRFSPRTRAFLSGEARA